jgi:hypothetical protein
MYSDKDFPKKTAVGGKPMGDEICCESSSDETFCKDIFGKGGGPWKEVTPGNW